MEGCCSCGAMDDLCAACHECRSCCCCEVEEEYGEDIPDDWNPSELGEEE